MVDQATGISMREGPHWRVRAAIAAAAGVMTVGLGKVTVFGAWMVVPAATAAAGALGLMIAGRHAHGARASVTGAVAAVSLAATAGTLLTGATYAASSRAATAWAIAETAALLVLIVMTVRVAPRIPGVLVAGVSGIAVPVWLLRFGTEAWEVEMLAGLAAWGLASVLAVTVGLYLRALDERRTRSVAEARSAQRVQLARDLHDFVAHDISAMLAQAQAGQILIERDTAAAAAAFRRIADSGERAMASMDHAVHTLNDTDADISARASPPTLIDLPELTARFAAAGAAEVRLDLDPELEPPELPCEVTTTAYRIIVEALTNVRRHANDALHVEVAVHRTSSPHGVEITITDDGPGSPSVPIQRPSGLGLSGLRERVKALGGTLTARPDAATGWKVEAFLPLRYHARSHRG